MNPTHLFNKWFSEEKALNKLKIPAACCLSTIGLDGYPNARFVSLKEISNESFVITGPFNSRKGKEIENCRNVALTFWWTSTERQVRIQGEAFRISEVEAAKYFERRNKDAQIVSATFEQGKEIQSIDHLKKQFEEKKEALEKKGIEKPINWGGIFLNPIRIEFMEFKESRLHERKLFQKLGNEWEMKILQP